MEPQPYIKQTDFTDWDNRAFLHPVNATFLPQACDNFLCVCMYVVYKEPHLCQWLMR